MQQDLYAVYGASGCGRSIMPLARHQLALAGVPASRLVFVDDAPGPALVNDQRQGARRHQSVWRGNDARFYWQT